MNKINVACEYDEHMIIAEQESEQLDQLRERIEQQALRFRNW